MYAVFVAASSVGPVVSSSHFDRVLTCLLSKVSWFLTIVFLRPALCLVCLRQIAF